MGMEDWIGWAASALLIATLVRQILKQWRSESTDGVSGWLFLGQSASSVGFIIYSVLLGNLVFIVTNSLILLTALAGQAVYLWRRKHKNG
ncbi:MAG TPA: SemiSWEET family transporter [Stenotrophomonas sp.]|jgi:uncharacterized protein with PQ loop repeat